MVEFIVRGKVIDLMPYQDVALTIENPFFSNDHIPVAWTTEVEAPASRENCRLFGYPMLLPCQYKDVDAEMRVDSVPLMYGKLKLMGADKWVLKLSFVGVSVEDSMTGSLKDAPFGKWNFGHYDNGDGARFDEALLQEVIDGAIANTREEFAAPMMMRESEKGTPDINSPDMTEMRDLYIAKYANAPLGFYLIPVVKLQYILRVIFADYQIDGIFADFFESIGIVAPYRKNGSIENPCGLDTDEKGDYIIDLAEAMPDVTVADFLKSLLTTFCATLYVTKGRKRIIGNKTILQSREFVDWSPKLSDDFEHVREDGQDYEYGFSGVSDTDVGVDIINLQTIDECFKAKEGATIRCTATGDIYKTVSHVNSGVGLEIIKQEGLIPDPVDGDATETFSAMSDFVPVKSLPSVITVGIPSPSVIFWNEHRMIPIVEIPSVGGTRSSTIQFGTLAASKGSDYFLAQQQVQMTSNGCYGKENGFSTPGANALNLGGPKGIYERYHRVFREWLREDKTTTKATVNLTVVDLANLQIWKKVMLYNRLFFIKNLTITLNTSKNHILTEAEFVQA